MMNKLFDQKRLDIERGHLSSKEVRSIVPPANVINKCMINFRIAILSIVYQIN